MTYTKHLLLDILAYYVKRNKYISLLLYGFILIIRRGHIDSKVKSAGTSHCVINFLNQQQPTPLTAGNKRKTNWELVYFHSMKILSIPTIAFDTLATRSRRDTSQWDFQNSKLIFQT